ncbi:MAG: transposase [Sulfobacillus thermosulfidooxidans]|uniref:Transposase n=1 Tax=Sulfobacillus thermosulfidooxidans TaxID=28034 RepID=A0A2T2WPS2_SULTH|nr:MAG: transposase [Sulfobacillus thermosulfidooxidans]
MSDELRILVGQGRRIDADYQTPPIATYQGNPFIEALPPIWSEEEVGQQLTYAPLYSLQDRDIPAHYRLHLIQNTLQFFEPLPVHLELEQRFSRMIRIGYLARNPRDPRFVAQLHENADLIANEGSLSSATRSTATGFTILGMSGVGKTTSVERVLSLYPQLIGHHEYAGRPLTVMQVVWLKLDCPFDGSIKGLCLNFFQAIDDLLGSRYYERYASGRHTVDELLPRMARVAALHGLGVLVIDEIQHLSEAKSGGSRKMLNFFVQLINTIGLPVVLVGTYKAQALLSGEFRQTRRGTGQGDFIWDRMANDEVWQFFVESLWRFQYTRRLVPLTPALRDALYDASQGITDFAVKLYMLAQARAITRNDDTITPALIRSVAKDSLRLASPILEALRTGNIRLLQGVDDVVPLDVERYLAEAERSVTTMGRLDSLRKPADQSSSVTGESALVGWLIEAGVPKIVARQAVEFIQSDEATSLLDDRQNALEKARALMQSTPGSEDSPSAQMPEAVKKRPSQKQEGAPESLVLKSVVQTGLKARRSAYGALKNAGWIQSMEAFVS